jgi:hypothetical protein
MLVLKRVTLLTVELAVLALGIWAAFAFAIFFDVLDSWLAVTGFFSIPTFSVLAFVLFPRKSHQWKTTLDAAAFLKDRAIRQQHPVRAKITRRLRRSLLWLPVLAAAFALFFLPATSHIVYSSQHLVPHYKFAVPFNWMIIKAGRDYPMAWVYFSNEGSAKHGFTPQWFNHSLPSSATFLVTDPASTFQWYHPRTEGAEARTTLIQQVTFKIGEIEMDCWEYEASYLRYGNPLMTDAPKILCDTKCATRANGRNFNLHASFLGRKDDRPFFYQVLRTATPE